MTPTPTAPPAAPLTVGDAVATIIAMFPNDWVRETAGPPA